MVNGSNLYAVLEPDFATPVAHSPQNRARLGTTQAPNRTEPHKPSEHVPNGGVYTHTGRTCLQINARVSKNLKNINPLA